MQMQRVQVRAIVRDSQDVRTNGSLPLFLDSNGGCFRRAESMSLATRGAAQWDGKGPVRCVQPS